MKTINIDILIRDYRGGRRFSHDFYVNSDSKDSAFEEMIRLDTLGICIVQHGIYRIRLNKKEYTLKECEILIACTNDFYDNVSFSNDFEGLVVFASVDMIADVVDSTHLCHCLEGLKYHPVHKITPKKWELMKSYIALFKIKAGIFDSQESDDTAAAVGKAFLADIFNLILNNIETSPDKKAATRPQLLYRQFINLLVSTPSKPHDVEYYAKVLSITPRYLATLCKDVSGKSARVWIMEYIMNDVRRYLIGSDLSIKEIASRTLFTNFSFFSKSVKRYFRMTPLELRNSRNK